MILERFPDIQDLSSEEKRILAEELLDELNVPELSAAQGDAVLEVLNARWEAYQQSPSSGSPWSESRERLQDQTRGSWRR